MFVRTLNYLTVKY